MLALGAICQIGQIVLLRELLMVFQGNELSIGIILAAWMVWVGLGSRLGGTLAQRVRRPVVVLALDSAGVLVGLPATILAIRALRGVFDVVPGAHLSLQDMTLSCLAVMAPVCLLLGAQFVLLARIWREADGAQDTTGAEKTYIGEALGNTLGGIVFTFLLVHHLSSFHAAVLAAVLTPAALLWLTRRGTERTGSISTGTRAALVGLVAAAAVVLPFLGRLDSWAHWVRWRVFAPAYDLVETRESRYGTISVVQREDQYSFFQSGNLVFSTGGAKEPESLLEEQEGAVFAHFSLVQHPSPERILLIGGGLRGTLREMLRHGVESVDYIELDAALTEAARPYLPAATLQALEDPRVRLLHTDGRLFVKGTDRTYDMIIVDGPDPSTAVLNRYYTEEFFREARSRLNPGGVLVVGVTSTADLRERALANRNAAIYHTLRRAFPHVLPAGERFLFYFATDTPDQLSADPHTLQVRFMERGVESRAFSPWHFHTLLQDAQVRRVNWILRHHGRSPGAHLEPPPRGPMLVGPIEDLEQEEEDLPPVQERYFINSDFRPIGYYYTLIYWNMQARADHAYALRWMLHVQPWWILPLVGASLLTVGGLRLLTRRKDSRPDAHFALFCAVFTTGLSTMALQIALLFSFQSIYGFVYEMVGLIVAIFMAGLALGTALTHVFVRDKANMRTLALVQLLIAVFAGVVAVALPRFAAVESPRLVFALFSAVTFGAGLLNGVDFPLATACCLRLRGGAEKATGIVYGVELFGACTGALLASVVVAPVLGLVACCLLATVANGSACLILIVARMSYGKA